MAVPAVEAATGLVETKADGEANFAAKKSHCEAPTICVCYIIHTIVDNRGCQVLPFDYSGRAAGTAGGIDSTSYAQKPNVRTPAVPSTERG